MGKIELNKSEQNENNALSELLKSRLGDLTHYFDTVQIIATKYDKETDLTTRFSNGFGNIYARVGAVEFWLKEQQLIAEDFNDDEEEE